MRKPNQILLSLSLGMLALLALILSGPAKSVMAVLDTEGVALYLPLVMKNYTPSGGPGSLVGYVVDARDGDPIQEANVCVSGLCDLSNALGYYELLDIPSGLKSLEVTAGGWIPVSEYVTIYPGVEREMTIAIPVDDQGENVLQIVLTWGPPWNLTNPAYSPGDLDAHLWITHTLWTQAFHIDASATSSYGDCDVSPYACYIYDHDVIDGYGPETIMVSQALDDARSAYAVLNYDNGRPGVPNITHTEAVVRVFQGDDHLYTFVVPAAGTGDLWYVFDILKSGSSPVIVPKNCITSYPYDSLPVCP